jgi:mannitol-specific phosphotransferase system IIBC component
MPFIGLVVFTIFPVLASRRFNEGGLRALGAAAIVAWGVITATLFVMGETPRSGLAAAELVAYGVIWTLPLLVACVAILLAARLKFATLGQMMLAYVTECIAIAPALWLALAACVRIRGSACSAP